jgi:prepilin-type N-terminal cleavage/methylation domain-containing protein
MNKLIKNRKGFTLVELILVLALLSIVMVPLSSFMIVNYKYLNKANKQIEAQAEAESAVNAISGILQSAKEAAARSFVDGNPSQGVERMVFELADGSYTVFQYVDSDSDGSRDAVCAKNTSDINELIASSEIQATAIARNVAFFNIELKPDNDDMTKSNMAVITITTTDDDKSQINESTTVKSEIFMRNSKK